MWEGHMTSGHELYKSEIGINKISSVVKYGDR